ncbi:unnamed protein product, partial [Clonostachys byssicola]
MLQLVVERLELTQARILSHGSPNRSHAVGVSCTQIVSVIDDNVTGSQVQPRLRSSAKFWCVSASTLASGRLGTTPAPH